MHIKCEQCATTYLLDDKLIPPQGAPVQCTRCSHVFIAKLDSPHAVTAPQPPPTSRTQMFGAPGSGSGPGAAPTNKTVMFGVPGADPAPQGQGGPSRLPAANKTMMFGNEGAGAAPAPAAGAGAANRTMMFGAAGADASGPVPPQQAPANPRSTMMFGSPVADAPGAVPQQAPVNPRSTMMFGAPAADAIPGTQPVNRTMMFGAPGADSPAQPQQAAPGGATHKTMMFGAGGGEAPGAVPQQQQQPAANPRSTMMFGAVPPAGQGGPTQPPPPRTSNTMMFGTPVGAAPPAAPPQGPGQQKTSTTMMFGSPVAAAPPAASPPGAQKTSSTMMFGATPVVGPGPAKAPKLTEATVRIGPEDLERMMREHESLGRGSADGGLTPPESPAADRQNKTQMFAMSDPPEGATPPAGNDAVSRQNKTQMFAMSDQPEPVSQSKRSPRAAPLPNREGALPPPPGVDSSILDTFPPDAQRPNLPPPRAADVGPMPDETLLDAGVRATEPAFADSKRLENRKKLATNASLDDGRVDLPPAPRDLMEVGSDKSTQPMSAVDADPAAVLRAQVARRNRIALIFISLILVGAALAVTWTVFGKKLLNRAPPMAAVEACEKALSALRFDDSKAKADAVEQLEALVAKYPDYVEGHAALVTAVSLQVDDVQQRVRRIEQLVERKNSAVARLNKDKGPNWEATAQALSAQVDELIKEHKPLSEQGKELDTQARAAYKGLESAVNRVGDPSKQARLAALRAQALFHGVSGTDQALVLSKRYETTAAGSAPDGWIDLAIPEYAANARVSEELMAQAQAKLDELHKRDSTFLRTYVLSARLHLIKKELEAASSDLDQVLSMRKDHDVAAELREWVRKLPKSEEKKDAPAP